MEMRFRFLNTQHEVKVCNTIRIVIALATFILDKDGVILATKLRGGALEAKISELETVLKIDPKGNFESQEAQS